MKSVKPLIASIIGIGIVGWGWVQLLPSIPATAY